MLFENCARPEHGKQLRLSGDGAVLVGHCTQSKRKLNRD